MALSRRTQIVLLVAFAAPLALAYVGFGLLLVGILLSAILGPVLNSGYPNPTVDGPESPVLLAFPKGTLVIAEDFRDYDGVSLLSLATFEERTIEFEGTARAHSGIDANGRIVYVEPKRNHYRLVVHELESAEERVLHEWDGELWHRPRLALSHTMGRVALVSEVHLGAFETTPERLDVVDLDGNVLHTVEAHFPRTGPQWLSDDRRIVFDAPFDKDRRVARVGVLDVETGELTMLDGEGPVVNRELDLVLIEIRDDVFRLVHPDGTIVRDELTVPGRMYEILALLDEDLVLYHGLPTTGTEQKLFSGFRTMGPGAQWTIKIADLRDGAFATLIPYHHDKLVVHCALGAD